MREYLPCGHVWVEGIFFAGYALARREYVIDIFIFISGFLHQGVGGWLQLQLVYLDF